MTLSLRAAQSLGIATKIITVTLSIAQTFIILRILSPAEYGIIGIVLSLGSLVGVTQYMGIVDAIIREIAVAKDTIKKAHVFWVSLWTRLIITIPISIIIALLAGFIGTRIYPLPNIPELVRLMSLILILQGIQGVLGGVYTGQLALRRLYIFQIIMSAVNLPIFALLAWYRGTTGYFEAMIITTILFSLLMAAFLKPVLGSLTHPAWPDIKSVFRGMIHTSAWTYVAKMLSVGWQRLPILILGRLAPPETVGLFNVALTFGSKIIFVTGIGEINLAYLSHTFARQTNKFRQTIQRTMGEITTIVALAAAFLSLFAPELLRLFAGEAYVPAATVIILVTWGYALYAILDIASHTAFVPSRSSHLRALGFAILLIATVTSMWLLPLSPLMTAGWSVLIGAALALLASEILSRTKLNLSLFPHQLPVIATGALVLAIASATALPLFIRITLFALIGGIITWIGLQEIITKVYDRFRL